MVGCVSFLRRWKEKRKAQRQTQGALDFDWNDPLARAKTTLLLSSEYLPSPLVQVPEICMQVRAIQEQQGEAILRATRAVDEAWERREP